MQKMIQLFVAFCVATVLAQMIVVGMVAANGNLRSETVYKGLALLNGIDITGDELKKVLDDYKSTPNPKYEDVENERARLDKNLVMRESAIRRATRELETLQAKLQTDAASFDRRTKEFYEVLDMQEKNLLDEGLRNVQVTLEMLSADQAKEQLLRMHKIDRLDDVVAILKGMTPDSRKKILGEFTDTAKKEPDVLHEIMMRMRAGEPGLSVIRNARPEKPTA